MLWKNLNLLYSLSIPGFGYNRADMSDRIQELFRGIRAELPLLVGVLPFGMIYGIMAVRAGIPPGASQAMSAILFAGSSQFITVQLITQSTPALVIIFTAFIVNMRHMLYSATLAPYVMHLPAKWKTVLAYLLTDEAFAVTIMNYQDEGRPLTYKHWFYLGAGLTLWSSWQVSTALGVFFGAQVPETWALDFSLALTFIALVVPGLNNRPSVAAALSAGIMALISCNWPLKLGLVAASLTGVAVGVFIEMRWKRSG